ncbi:F-box/kelch-repeat protein [Pyrus ussuriensis x Pyrus communis]|uniref:F-box/kelch-repeat protein n=1 Tax=Pyrus ussuriensis x Pyrus communis TaxID=2448454 RepID=A0A5N5G601_9ROSA|nr:F-box/kelch-repeat protein [Pyrus ussuriensis x Pyrus communis]
MAEGGLPERQTQLVPSDHGACIFTNDITIEILSWVPGKSILRFRRVCKSWRTLISDPYFVRKQLSHAVRRINNNNNDNLRLLTFTSTSHLKSIDYESLLTLLAKNKHENASRVVVPLCRKHKLPLVEPQRRFVQIMGSSNGLICLQINCLDVVLWNPCTGNANKLPKPTSSAFCENLTSNRQYEIFLFTLKMGSRRTVEGLNHVELIGRGLLLNRALHWLDRKRGEGSQIDSKLRIISFDLAEENFQEPVRLPIVIEEQSMIWADVGDYRGSHLLCFLTHFCCRNRSTEIWVMAEYGFEESWTKLIVLNVIPYINPHLLYVLEDDNVYVGSSSGNLILYDGKGQRYRSAITPKKSLSLQLAMYVETLLSPVTGR